MAVPEVPDLLQLFVAFRGGRSDFSNDPQNLKGPRHAPKAVQKAKQSNTRPSTTNKFQRIYDDYIVQLASVVLSAAQRSYSGLVIFIFVLKKHREGFPDGGVFNICLRGFCYLFDFLQILNPIFGFLVIFCAGPTGKDPLFSPQETRLGGPRAITSKPR